MTAVPLQPPPPQVPANDPRPRIETLRRWPFVVIGVVAILILAGITIGPRLMRGEPEQKHHEEPRMNQPHPLAGLPMTYGGPPVTAPEPLPAAPAPPSPEEPASAQPSSPSSHPQGPTHAELLKQARMANLKPSDIKPAGFIQDEGMAGHGGGEHGPAGRLYNPNSLVEPFPCQVDAGTNIPAMTEERITSESPGTVSAVTTRDIWSADKKCFAVPRGTRFVGRYQTEVGEGQARLGIIWTGLTRPPPRNDTMHLNDTVAGDPDGTAGISGEVDTHFWKKLGYVAAASLLDIAKTVITANGDGGVGTAIAGIFAGRAASPVDEWAKRQLDIPTVINVPPREISIVLAQHLQMDEFRDLRGQR